ncbi:MAG TPA: peptidoglycan-associated lipoprotein Pal, partial [Ramlibacter sp.]|nr:peptidoglycan-associated lipoprotein Pal [Ramlibacter sp.]
MMNRTFRGLSLALALTLTLVGCSSVKLDDVPVEDKSASSTVGQPGAGGGAASESRVAPVAADSAALTAAGPVNVARLVYFDYDSYSIKPEFQSLIEAHARFLKANTGRRVALEGHTDERGGREYNLALGQRRAEAVRRALALLGVADNQMEAVSFGKEKPAVPGSDEQAWAKNRRV